MSGALILISGLRVKETRGKRQAGRAEIEKETERMHFSGCITLRIISNVKILVKT